MNRIDLVLSYFNVAIDNGNSPPPAPLTDVAVTSVSAPSSINQGATASIVVTVKNVGNQSVGSFNVGLQDATDNVAVGTPQPTSAALIRHIKENRPKVDYFFFFSYRYYHAYHGVRAAAGKAVLVPTAERDHAIGLNIFQPIFRGVRALMYNSPEERRMIQTAARNGDVPGVVVGIGSEIPPRAQVQADRFRQKYGITGRFALYVGRIDQNKGCKELFTYFLQALPAGAFTRSARSTA